MQNESLSFQLSLLVTFAHKYLKSKLHFKSFVLYFNEIIITFQFT
ncbi:MAG: hypothetical protein ACEY26_00475 [Candidatus Hodgkinia cicadicola]